MAAETKEVSGSEMSLKDQGNEFFKSGKYLKAAALYTQAIKQDPSNPTLYRYPPFLQIFHLGVIVHFFQLVGFKFCFCILLFCFLSCLFCVFVLKTKSQKGIFFAILIVIILI